MKTIKIVMMTCILLIASTALAYGNPYTLQAENGLIQPPTGLLFEVTGSVAQTGATAQLEPVIKAAISYGAFTSITITGEFVKSFNDNNISGKMIKLYYSPVHQQKGYTVYLNYDLDNWEIPVYGVSLWLNTNFLMTYVNLQAITRNEPGAIPLMVTPGASLNLGRLGIGAEIAVQPGNWSLQDMRAGINYELVKGIHAKLVYKAGMNHNLNQGYNLGLAMEL